MAGMGPPPKPANKRRHSTPPKSWGGASPIEAPAASVQDRELGIKDPHPLVARMWAALQSSAEARFFSQADWVRAAMELWFADTAIRNPTAAAWAQVQHGLTELLISPAAKRRCAIELKAATPDTDENTAVLTIAKYQDKLKPESHR